MYRIDPVSGCKVLTMAGFWASEAAYEGRGRSGGEVMAEFMGQVLEEEEREAEAFKAHCREHALEILRGAVSEERAALLKSRVHTPTYLFYAWQYALRQHNWRSLHYALFQSRSIFQDCNAPVPPIPLRVEEIMHLAITSGFGGGGEELDAVVETDDGFYLMSYRHEYSYDTRMQPGDDEEYVTCRKLGPGGYGFA